MASPSVDALLPLLSSRRAVVAWPVASLLVTFPVTRFATWDGVVDLFDLVTTPVTAAVTPAAG